MTKYGRFSSSKISSLVPMGKVKMNETELKLHKAEFPSSQVKMKDGGFQAGGLTYINERNIEKKLQRSLRRSPYTRDIFWGHLMEKIVFEVLPVEYKLVSKEVLEHPTLPDIWCGTPDLRIPDLLVSEIKCYQLKGFAEYADMLMLGSVETFRSEFPQEYWQIVSNAIICNVDFGEAIAYMPYKSDLVDIRDMIENSNLLERWNFEPWQARYIVEESIEELSYIEEGGHYKDITTFRFEVPIEDKEYLTKRVMEASKLLIK